MTHTDLVNIAERYLLKTKGCAFAFKELCAYTPNGETPDCIGWKGNYSILIECKATRSDFLSDRKKRFRRNPDKGMGNFRLYMAPTGLITERDLKSFNGTRKWGLVEVNEAGRPRQVLGPKGNYFRGKTGTNYYHTEKCWRSEARMMTSALRRLHIRGMLDSIYVPHCRQ
jgi:hypothetical protein